MRYYEVQLWCATDRAAVKRPADVVGYVQADDSDDAIAIAGREALTLREREAGYIGTAAPLE